MVCLVLKFVLRRGVVPGVVELEGWIDLAEQVGDEPVYNAERHGIA